MQTTQALQEHHTHCDDLFAAAEAAAHQRQWPAARDAWGQFSAQLLRHFACEESTLFPAFENRSGMTMGPTEVMRGEHADMRELLARLDQLLLDEDLDGFAGTAETLLILMQQHNVKEENILYPMCDSVLADESDLGAAIERCLALELEAQAS